MIAVAQSPVESLLEAALRLTHEEKVAFLDRFSVVVDEEEESNGPLSPEWMTEIERRIAQDKAGLSEWVPAEEVVRSLRSSLSQPA